NETMAILPSVYFFYHFTSQSFVELIKLVRRTILLAAPLIVTLGPIRYATRNHPVLGGGYHLPDNVCGILSDMNRNPLDAPFAGYLLFLILLSGLCGYAVVQWRSQPLFLRRAAAV